MKRLLLVVSGSVAAYKSAYIVDKLVNEYEVNVVMTKNACNFITPFQLQCLSKNHVATDIINHQSLCVDHIELAKRADVIIIVPATANIIGKVANGIADDMATATLIVQSKAKKFFAPAMNADMYNNPVVQRNIHTLINDGWKELKPRVGTLACGGKGLGTLAKEDEIVASLKEALCN